MREIVAVAVDAAVFVLLPWCVWRLLGRRIPFAVLPIVIGLLLAMFAAPAAGTIASGIGQQVGWIGVLLLAFTAGMETRLVAQDEAQGHHADGSHAPVARVALPRLVASAVLALLLPFAAGALAAKTLLLGLPGWMPPRGGSVLAAVALGLCIAVSALPVLVGIVRELRGQHRALGNLALRIAVIDDAVLWSGLAGLLLAAGIGGEAGAEPPRVVLALAVLAALFVSGRVLQRVAPPGLMPWALAATRLAAGAWASAELGLHELLGAYFAGAAMAPRWIARLPVEKLGTLALFGLASLFFGHSGLKIEAGVLTATTLAIAVGLLLLSASAKLAATRLCPPLPSLARHETLAVGALLQCKGLMEIVAATILRDKGLLSESAFAALVTLAVLSTLLTGPLFRAYMRRAPVVAVAPERG